MLKIKWADVKGYEGIYCVSSDGGIFRTSSNNPLKKAINNKGYAYVSLCRNGMSKKVTVHRIVATAFIDGVGIVNHKNGNKQDNRLSNLEFVSYSENNKHAYRTGLKKPSKNTQAGVSHLSFKGVIVGTHLVTSEKVFLYGKTDMRSKGFGHQNVYACVSGRLKKYKNYTFERLENGVIPC